MADAALGQSDQAFTERGRMDTVADGQAKAARLVFSGSDGLGGDKKIMQASQARKSDLVGGIQQVFGLAEQFLGAFLGQVLQEALGADACPACEHPLKMIFTQSDAGRHFIQVGLVFIMDFKVLDRLLDAQVIFGKLFVIGERFFHFFSFERCLNYRNLSAGRIPDSCFK